MAGGHPAPMPNARMYPVSWQWHVLSAAASLGPDCSSLSSATVVGDVPVRDQLCTPLLTLAASVQVDLSGRSC